MQRTESGEEAPARRSGQPGFAPPPPPTAGANQKDQAAGVRKKLQAEPLKEAAKDTKPWGQVKALYRGSDQKDTAQERASTSAPAESPSASPYPPLATEGAREGRVCGQVVDAAGRPVAGAQVVVADAGRTTTTDARGAFCTTAPLGEHPLVVMAVGYSEARQTVTADLQPAPVRVTLAAVPVLEGGGMASRPTLGFMGSRSSAPTQGPADRYAALSDSTLQVLRDANRLQSEAAARRSAGLFDASAAAWERALRRMEGGPLELETRWHVAEARYRAWESGRNSRRAGAAVEALTAYIVRAPAGPERAQATRWLDQVRQ